LLAKRRKQLLLNNRFSVFEEKAIEFDDVKVYGELMRKAEPDSKVKQPMDLALSTPMVLPARKSKIFQPGYQRPLVPLVLRGFSELNLPKPMVREDKKSGIAKLMRPSQGNNRSKTHYYHYLKKNLPTKRPDYYLTMDELIPEGAAVPIKEKGPYKVGNTSSARKFLYKAQELRDLILDSMNRFWVKRKDPGKAWIRLFNQSLFALRPDKDSCHNWFNELAAVARMFKKFLKTLDIKSEARPEGRPIDNSTLRDRTSFY